MSARERRLRAQQVALLRALGWTQARTAGEPGTTWIRESHMSGSYADSICRQTVGARYVRTDRALSTWPRRKVLVIERLHMIIVRDDSHMLRAYVCERGGVSDQLAWLRECYGVEALLVAA